MMNREISIKSVTCEEERDDDYLLLLRNNS